MSVFRSKFPKTMLVISVILMLLIGASLAHDQYAAQKDGSNFYFAHIGRVFEKYLPTLFEKFVNLVGMERINGPLEPLMTFPLTFVFIGLFALTVLAGLLSMIIRKQSNFDTLSTSSKVASVTKTAPSYKDRALNRRH